MNDFDEWNKVKKNIDQLSIKFFLRKGEIWLCNIGKNVGFETNGKNKDFVRPVLIIKTYKESGAIVLPLTSKRKDNFFHFKLKNGGNLKLTQIRFLDRRRFKRKINQVSSIELKEIRRKLFLVI